MNILPSGSRSEGVSLPISDKLIPQKQTILPSKNEIDATIQKLKELAHPERLKEFQLLAQKILDAPPEILTNSKQFAFLHCGAYLKDTKIEGGNSQDVLPYWKELTNAWKQGKAQIVTPALTPEDINQISDGIADLDDFDQLIQSKSPASEFQKKVKEKLEQKGQCYFPTGWVGNPGHFMVCKFKLENDQVIMELMTKGGGIEFHPLISISENRCKKDYRFYPIEISQNALFNEPLGKTFFERLCKFRENPEGSVKKLDADDLYGLFLLTGKVLPRKEEDIIQYSVGVTSQRAGTCVETGLHMLIYEGNPQQVKRNLFAIKFQSLVDRYRQSKKGLAYDSDEAFYLNLAAKEHLTRLLKLHPEVINEEEFLLGYAIGTEILSKSQEILDTEENRRVSTIPNVTPARLIPEKPLADINKIAETYYHISGSEDIHKAKTQVIAAKTIQTAEDVIPSLESLIKDIENISESRKSGYNSDYKRNQYDLFAQIQILISSLPFASGELEDKFWDALPKDKIPRCLELLSQVVFLAQMNCGTKKYSEFEYKANYYDFPRLQEISLKAYDIGIQLSQRLDDLKLANYGFSFPAQLPSYVMNPTTATTLEKINENFNKRNGRAKLGNLFPNEIQTDNFLKTPHGSYLNQFLNQKTKAVLGSKWETAAAVDQTKMLYPKPFYDLQTLAYFSLLRNSELIKLENKFSNTTDNLWEQAAYKIKDNSNKLILSHATNSYYENSHPKVSTDPYGVTLLTSKPLPVEPNSLLNYLSTFISTKNDSEIYFENGVYSTAPQLKKNTSYSVNTLKTDHPPLPKHILEQLMLFKSEPKLQAIEALNWARENPHFLSNPFVQGYLEAVIYQLGILSGNLKDAPEPTINRIHSFLMEAFHNYAGQPSQLQTILWLTRMGVSLEGFIAKYAKKQSDKEFPDYYQILQSISSKTLDPEARSEIYQHMLIAYENYPSNSLTDEDYRHLLSARLSLEMTSWKIDPLTPNVNLHAAHSYLKHHSSIKQFISSLDIENRSCFLNDVFKEITQQNVNYTWENQGDFIRATEQPYALHLDNFSLYYKNVKIKDFDKTITESTEYKQLFGDKPFKALFKNGSYYIQPNEEYRIFTPDVSERIRIQKLMRVGNSISWLDFIPIKLKKDNKPSEITKFPIPLLSENMKWWRYREDNPKDYFKEETRIYLTDSRSGEFKYYYDEKLGLRPANPITGNPLDQKVLNLISAEKGSFEEEWSQFLKYTDNLENIIVTQKVDAANRDIERIEFSGLGGLSFQLVDVKGEKRLRCDQDPEFYLAKEQDIKALHHLRGPLLLEDAARKLQKVIVPAQEFKNSSFPSSYIELDLNNKIHTGGKPYFVYDLNKELGILKPESPRAALYLALILRSQKDYTKAYEYLKQSYKYSNDEIEDLKMVKQCLKADFFPEACAFDCHLGLRMKEHRNKHTRKKFNEKRNEELTTIDKELDSHFSKQYQGYLERMSDAKEGIGAIPETLRLSPHQSQCYILDKSPNAIVEFDLKESINLSCEEASKMIENKVNVDFLTLSPLKTGYIRCPESDISKYLAEHFLNFCQLARSLKGDELKNLKMDLFYLYKTPNELDNLAKYLIKVILSVMQKPQLYNGINIAMFSKRSFIEIPKSIFKIYDSNFGQKGTQLDYSLQTTTEVSSEKIKQKNKDAILTSIQQEKASQFNLIINSSISEISKKPLLDIANEFISNRKDVPLAVGEFSLDKLDTSSEPPLVSRQISDLRKGHEINKTKTTTIHEMRGRHEIWAAKIKENIEQDEERSSILIKELVKLANVTIFQQNKGLSGLELQQHLNHAAKQSVGQVKEISLDILIMHFLRRDVQGLSKLNPALNSTDIETINNKLLELFIFSSRAKQGHEAFDITQKLSKTSNPNEIAALTQQLASIIDRTRSYDPKIHPLYLVYEFATSMLLRPEQVEQLNWIFRNFDNPSIKNILFQFAAGGGKTKVLMPIISFYLAEKGYLPVGLNISSLYEIGKGDLDKSLMKAFKQQLEVLEIELDTPISVDELKKIFLDLQTYHKEKKCLCIKTETWHALKLKYEQALELGNAAEVDTYHGILDFLQKLGVSLIDEGHQSLDPLHESNIATGQSSQLSTRENKLIIALTNMLSGDRGDISILYPTGERKKIRDVVRLIENKQALLTDSDLEIVKNALIEALIKDPILQEVRFHPVLQKAANSSDPLAVEKLLLDYLKSPPSDKPEWIVEMRSSGALADRELTSMLALAKKFLYETSPHTLRLIQAINYGDSLHPGDLTCAPRHNKQPVSSKFQDIYVTLALTVQNVVQEGLNGEKIKNLMQILLKEHRVQKTALAGEIQDTKAQALFNHWWGNNSEPLFLDQVFLDNPQQMDEIAQQIGKNTDVIQQYLLKCALPQIKVFHEKMASTPPDLLEGFFKNIAFSATPGLLELYPVEMANLGVEMNQSDTQYPGIKLDYGFEPLVMEMLCQPHNRHITAVNLENLEEFFENLEAQAPGILKNICCIIDQGGIFRAFENPKVIKALLTYAAKNNIPFTGGIYRKENKGLMQNETGQLMLQQKDSDGRDIALRGSDLKEALKVVGLNFDQMLLATFFDKAITTGADIAQPLQGQGLLTVGEGGTKTYALQAAMRLRKLLLGVNGQSVHWIVEQELLKQISNQNLDKLTIEDIFLWMIKNESQLIEKALIMRAFQGVQHLVRRIVWKEIKAEGISAETRIKLYQKYRKGMVDSLSVDPYETFGKKMTLENADIVLSRYADQCAKNLGLEEEYRLMMPELDKLALNTLIDQTKQLVGKINQAGAEMSQEMHQQQESRQEVRQEQRALQEADQYYPYWTTAHEVYSLSNHNIFDSNFLSQKFLAYKRWYQHQPLKDFLQMKFIPDDIIVSDPFLHVRAEFLNQRELRPIKYILVVQDGTSPPKYLPCSRRGANHYYEQLMSKKIPLKDRKVMLLDDDGKLVINGQAEMGFNPGDQQALLQSDAFKNRLVIMQFANGVVKDIVRLKKYIRENCSQEEYDNAVKIIRAIHVGETPIDNESLEEVHKFRKALVLTEDISESFTSYDIIRKIVRYFFPVRQPLKK